VHRHFAALVVAAVLLAPHAPAVAQTQMIMGTGSLAGSFYVMGTGLVKIWKDELPDLSISVTASIGTVPNLKLLEENKIHFAMVDNPLVGMILKESVPGFSADAVKDLKRIALKQRSMYSWPKGGWQLVTQADSGITSVRDLKGKRIALGARGSSAAVEAPIFLAEYGITASNSKFVYLSSTDILDQLGNRTIDCGFYTTFPPMGTIMEFAQTHKIRLLAMEEEPLKKFIEKVPGYYRTTFRRDVYGKNMVNTEDVVTAGFGASFWVRGDLSEDLVYNLTKALWKRIDDFHGVSAMSASVTRETALASFVLPLHEGAKKYYREAGMLK